MQYAGVLFDLYGTLVPPFRRRENMETIRECSNQLGIRFEDCHRHWVETFPRRMRGEFASMAENFDWIVRQTDRRATRPMLKRAEEIYKRSTIEGLEPVGDAIEVLEWLTSHGVRIALVSNCAPDIPRIWKETAFARYFDHCAFSCEVGAMKPEPEIYRSALDAIGLLPNEVLYVGDGSDEELSGAARCGMQPVLISVDLSNAYDAQRTDVDSWNGPVIRTLSEVPTLVAGIKRA